MKYGLMSDFHSPLSFQMLINDETVKMKVCQIPHIYRLVDLEHSSTTVAFDNNI